MKELVEIYEHFKSECRLNEPVYFACLADNMITYVPEAEDYELNIVCDFGYNTFLGEMEIVDLLNMKAIEYFELNFADSDKSICYNINQNIN